MLRRASLLAALTALLVPAAAGTANAATHAPTVSRVAPKHVFVGEVLTIYGHHFRRGVNKNTVAFKRDGAKAVLVKAEKGTTKLLKVTLPKRLEKVLVVRNGTPTPTRLKIRVLSAMFGKSYTKSSKSPIVGAEKPPAPDAPDPVDPNADCDGDGQANKIDTDDDNDLLADTLEKTLKLDQCKADSDKDGAEDGYEYQSARDLNDDEHQASNQYLPYPEKRPYPNPLDGQDADTDHDGDSLTLIEEYRLWKYSIAQGTPRTLERLSYSAGEQYSISERVGGGNRQPTLPAAGYSKQADFLAWATANGYAQVALSDIGTDLGDPQATWWAPRTLHDIRDADRKNGVSLDEQYYFDFGSGHRDGMLDDAERDEDSDGLSNFAETRGCMNRGYWDTIFASTETKYPLSFAPTDLDDADSDGDGVRDGADDQDHDDVPNIMECDRVLATAIDDNADGFLDEDPGNATTPRAGTVPRPKLPASGFINAFNPCLPHFSSRTCRQYIEGTPWAPFNANDKYYLIKD
jgi:hypothetical protein